MDYMGGEREREREVGFFSENYEAWMGKREGVDYKKWKMGVGWES